MEDLKIIEESVKYEGLTRVIYGICNLLLWGTFAVAFGSFVLFMVKGIPAHRELSAIEEDLRQINGEVTRLITYAHENNAFLEKLIQDNPELVGIYGE